MVARASSPHPMHQMLGACGRALGFAGLFSFAINVLLLTVSLYMMQVYDRVLTSRNSDTLLYLTAVALGALLVLGLLDVARSRLLGSVCAWLEQRLASRAFECALANSLRGRPYRSEALRDVRELRTFLGGPGVLALFDLPAMPLFLAAIFALHPLLGALSTAAAAALLGLAVLNDLAARRPLRAAAEMSVRSMRQVEAAGRNAEVVDALGMLSGVMRRWAGLHREAIRLQTLAANRTGAVVGASKFFRLAVQILMLGAGAWLVLRQELSGGAMVAGSIMLGRAMTPVEQAITAWKQMVEARGAYRRLAACLGEPPLRPPAMPLPAPRGALSLEGVHFAAPGASRLALRNVSFELAAGESVAVLGPSAAGKSTLARLLVGSARPTAGHVRLDGAELFAWNREDLGRHVGYLPQDIELFSGTVAENIARLADGDPAAVVAAAEMADVHEMILRLPQGYDTEIGEGGAHLSGGQRQRIALARALYGEPRLVVIDEPNAHLDAEGERALGSALGALKARGVTVVLVTHRPMLVAHVDRVLMLREGAVELFGAHADVLKRLRPRPAPQQGGPGLHESHLVPAE